MLDPPQTKSVWPVTKLLAGSQKKRKALVTSSTCPNRPTGMRLASAASRSLSLGMMPQKLSVCTGPGATTLTVIPCGASSSAQVRAMPIIPALDAE